MDTAKTRCTTTTAFDTLYPTFDTWLAAVNDHLGRYLLSTDDLADRCWHDAYDDGCDPQDAADEAMLEEIGK